MQPESASSEPIAPPESAPVPQPEVSAPAPAPKPAKKNGCVGILVGLLIFILVVGAAGVGYWDYTLNNNLVSTNNQTSVLQGKYDKLQSDNKQLSLDLAQAQADLEKVSGDLKKAQGNQTKAEDEAKAVQTRIADTQKLLDVASSMIIDNAKLSIVDGKIMATGNEKLISLWKTFKSSGKQADLDSFYDYLFTTIIGNLDKKSN